MNGSVFGDRFPRCSVDDSRIRSKTAPFSFENGLVWTGPKYTLKNVIACYPPSFRYFNEFLMAHHRQVAREIKDEYIDTMSKIYFSYFKTYISKLLKLQARKLQCIMFLVRDLFSIAEFHQHLPAHLM